jgi:hypothetical protein
VIFLAKFTRSKDTEGAFGNLAQPHVKDWTGGLLKTLASEEGREGKVRDHCLDTEVCEYREVGKTIAGVLLASRRR